MDKIDYKIIEELKEDGRKKFSDIARIVGLSRVAVASRLKKLVDTGKIRIYPEINLKEQKMIMAVILIESRDEERRENILEQYSSCPRVLLTGTAYGHYDIFALIFAEDRELLEILLSSCILKKIDGINKSSVMIVGELLKPGFLPIKRYNKRNISSIAPCGLDCSECTKFKQHICIACPLTTTYRGKLFQSDKEGL
ncbi:MAG: Lrp/AsnC family transcriptional regulator [Candidatus Odinarchaeota archaeon]